MTERAFTLIELILVSVILAILLVAAIPNFQRSSRHFSLEQHAFELAHLLRYARERAVAESQSIVWTWDSAQRRAHLEAVGEDGRATALEEHNVYSARLEPAAAMAIANKGEQTNCDCVHFFPDGSADGAEINLESQGDVYKILVDAQTGQTTLTAGAAAR